MTLRAVEEGKIVATVRTNGVAPQVSIEWGGGTGPQGIRAVCACGGSGVCTHVIAALEAVRTRAGAEPVAPAPQQTELDWLPSTSVAPAPRARSVWPVFSITDGTSLACSLFLDTPRLRGVLRESDAIASMLEQTPADDWDESDRRLIRDALSGEAFGARASIRALAQTMFRLCGHPRLRFDDRPDLLRHPSELPTFGIDPRGIKLFATLHGSEVIPRLESYDGRTLDLSRAIILAGPPAWIADTRCAYLLDPAFDAAKAARAVAAARQPLPEPSTQRPPLETIAQIAPYLSAEDRTELGIEDATDPGVRLALAWRDGALLVRATFLDRATGATVADGTIARVGDRIVRFRADLGRALGERLVGAGFVPRADGTFALHGPQRAADFIRNELPGWGDLEFVLDESLDGVTGGRAVDIRVAASRSSEREDWFELDVGVFIPGRATYA